MNKDNINGTNSASSAEKEVEMISIRKDLVERVIKNCDYILDSKASKLVVKMDLNAADRVRNIALFIKKVMQGEVIVVKELNPKPRLDIEAEAKAIFETK